jgi:hypothetical protein
MTRIEHLREVFTAKVRSYSALACKTALQDCHDTLRVGEYQCNDDYAIKLWAEIDALRERQLKIEQGKK